MSRIQIKKKMFILPDIVKQRIERQIGHPIAYPADCERLAMSIRSALNETIGTTTLKRIFGFVSDVDAPRLSTLDILSRYCGFDSYDDMKKSLVREGDSDFEDEPDIVSDRLPAGAVVRFTYLPDRLVALRHLEGSKFTVVESENGSLRVGDTVTIPCFYRAMPLIVTEVVRNGENLGRYVAGKVSGLTSLELADS